MKGSGGFIDGDSRTISFLCPGSGGSRVESQTSMRAEPSSIAEESAGTLPTPGFTLSALSSTGPEGLLLCAAPAEKPEAPEDRSSRGRAPLLRLVWKLDVEKVRSCGRRRTFRGGAPGHQDRVYSVETADTTSTCCNGLRKDPLYGHRWQPENAVPYAAKDLLMTFDEGFFRQPAVQAGFHSLVS